MSTLKENYKEYKTLKDIDNLLNEAFFLSGEALSTPIHKALKNNINKMNNLYNTMELRPNFNPKRLRQ